MKPTAVLDIGSSKVVCLVGEITEHDGIIVHGVGVASCESYLNGEFIDKQGLHDAIIDVIQKAEQESRQRIQKIIVSVPNCFLKTELSDITMSFNDQTEVIESSDLEKLYDLSLDKCGTPEGMNAINSTPVFFIVDGISSAESPIGIETDEISALVSHVFVRQDFIAAIQDILDDVGIEIDACHSAMQGEAMLLIPEQERVRPAVLIDVGYRQTDICVIENSAMTAISSIPVGGYQFASELAFGLEVTQESAEQAKRRFSFSLDYGDKTEILRTATESKRVANATIAYIIEARASELADLIREELERMSVNLDAKPVVYLTGGGLLMMRGSLDFMKKKLGISMKRDMPWTPRLSSPNYCSAFGMLYFELRVIPHADEAPAVPVADKEESFLTKLKNFFIK